MFDVNAENELRRVDDRVAEDESHVGDDKLDS